ncbi:hypothetical protein QTH89_24730 [Variovorax sp. J22G21]|uniref:hypothetical protein n=1 Tax=Variovorax fucosicus TaxID=3053517 RepID=UPI002574DC03|nr:MULTISPECIES: hypothetical protein [unclassified Variovorax]MDM0039670.1 hypothetical protein [Variovorax sp. J22R193]MDM0064445.1 hypothetical protein [Variovorax sp. J22G21]
MHASEFGILVLWLYSLPLLIGGGLLWRFARTTHRNMARAVLATEFAFVLLSLVAGVLLLLFAPAEFARLIDVRDVDLFGIKTLWSPIGIISSVIAWPFAALLGRRFGRIG